MAFGKLKINNFQAQESLDVDLGDITVITGPSDRGKSSCIRALAWLLFNDAPKDCTTWGKDHCCVQLQVDGHSVGRYRDRKENFYVLDGQKFACLRGSVPPEIQNVLKVVADNIQRQHDSVFWFSQTAGEVAKRLNSIVNLDIIDKVFEVRASKARKVSAELEVLNEMVCRGEDELKAMDGLPRIQQQASRLQAIMDSLEARKKDSARLVDLLAKVKKMQNSVDVLSEYCDSGNEFIKTGNVWEQMSERLERLQKLIGRIKSIDFLLNVELPDYADLDGALKEYEAADARMRRLRKLIEASSARMNEITALEERLDKERKLLVEKSQGRCPVCGGPLNESACS